MLLTLYNPGLLAVASIYDNGPSPPSSISPSPEPGSVSVSARDSHGLPSPPPRSHLQPVAEPQSSQPRVPPPQPTVLPIAAQTTYETPTSAAALDYGKALPSELTTPTVAISSADDVITTASVYAEIDPHHQPSASHAGPDVPDRDMVDNPSASPRQRVKGLRNFFKRKSNDVMVSPSQSPVSSRRGTAAVVIPEEATAIVAEPMYSTIPDEVTLEQPVRPKPYSNGMDPSSIGPRDRSATAGTDTSRRPRPKASVSQPFLAGGQRISMPATLLAACDPSDVPLEAPPPRRLVAPPRPASTFEGAELERCHSSISSYLEELAPWILPYEQLEVSEVVLGKGQFGCVKEAMLIAAECEWPLRSTLTVPYVVMLGSPGC